MTHLVRVVVADDTFVFGKSQFTALICGQGKGGQKARSQRMFWSIIVGNWNKARKLLFLHSIYDCITNPRAAQHCAESRSGAGEQRAHTLLHPALCMRSLVLPSVPKHQPSPFQRTAHADAASVPRPSQSALIPAFELTTGTQPLQRKQAKTCRCCQVFKYFGTFKKNNHLQYLNRYS